MFQCFGGKVKKAAAEDGVDTDVKRQRENKSSISRVGQAYITTDGAAVHEDKLVGNAEGSLKK